MSNNEENEQGEVLMKTNDKCSLCGQPLNLEKKCKNEDCERCIN